jgi:hypothetical protein
MGRALSDDLRTRVLQASSEGLSARQAAAGFRVGISTAIRRIARAGLGETTARVQRWQLRTPRLTVPAGEIVTVLGPNGAAHRPCACRRKPSCRPSPSRDVGAYFDATLKEAVGSHRHIDEIRGEGLLGAVELVLHKDDLAFFDTSQKGGRRITAALLEHSVTACAMPQGHILGFAPPICPTKQEANVVIKASRRALERVASTI